MRGTPCGDTCEYAPSSEGSWDTGGGGRAAGRESNLLLRDDPAADDVGQRRGARDQRGHEQAAPGGNAAGGEEGGAGVPAEGVALHALAQRRPRACVRLHGAEPGCPETSM